MHRNHDKFVRETFNDVNRAAAFFEQFLPDHILQVIDLRTLGAIQESYIDNELKEYFSDIVFEVSSRSNKDEKADIVLLFEHKSAPDKFLLIQVGHYMFSHWYKSIKNGEKLKVIIPVVYFQGKNRWEAPQLKEVFDKLPKSLMDFIPAIPHIFFDVNALSVKQIEMIKDRMMAAAILTHAWKDDPENLIEDLKRIFKLFPSNTRNVNFLKLTIVYLLQSPNITTEHIMKALEVAEEQIQYELTGALGEMLKKGQLEGEAIGMQKGEAIGIERMIVNGYENGVSIETLAVMAQISEGEVVDILKRKDLFD